MPRFVPTSVSPNDLISSSGLALQNNCSQRPSNPWARNFFSLLAPGNSTRRADVMAGAFKCLRIKFPARGSADESFPCARVRGEFLNPLPTLPQLWKVTLTHSSGRPGPSPSRECPLLCGGENLGESAIPSRFLRDGYELAFGAQL